MLSIRVVEWTTESHFQIKDLADGRRVSLQDHVFRAICPSAHVRCTGSEMRFKNAHRGRSGGHVRKSDNVLSQIRRQLIAFNPFVGWPRKLCRRKQLTE